MSFKICPGCGKIWNTQDDFLSDPELKIIGYKADFEKLDYGMFFFNHLQEACRSTITIEVLGFKNLYTGPVYTAKRSGLPECLGYCLKEDQLERCKEHCECGYAREIIQTIKGFHASNYSDEQERHSVISGPGSAPFI